MWIHTLAHQSLHCQEQHFKNWINYSVVNTSIMSMLVLTNLNDFVADLIRKFDRTNLSNQYFPYWYTAIRYSPSIFLISVTCAATVWGSIRLMLKQEMLSLLLSSNTVFTDRMTLEEKNVYLKRKTRGHNNFETSKYQ